MPRNEASTVPVPPGRETEAATLRRRVADPGPSLVLVTGRQGAGKSTLLRSALADEADPVWYEVPPLPDPDQRGLLARRLRFLRERREGGGPGEPGEISPGPDADWSEIFRALAEHLYVGRQKTLLVLDGWDLLVDSRSRLTEALEEFWREVRTRGLPLHLVLTAEPGAAADALRDPDDPFAEWLEEDVHLGPLPYRAVTAIPSGSWSPRDRLLLRAVFGGWAEVVTHLKGARSLKGAVTEVVLARDAPLLRWGTEVLERELQAAGRYASLLRALAGGARTWGDLAEAAPDFESGSQMAPYLERLRALELVAAERSLDAGPASRSRRYRLTDPFTGFWFRFVLSNLTDLQLGRAEEVWSERIRPALDAHAARAFPEICRAYMRDHADERLAARAREVGGLWGRGYDLDVSGTLWNGAIFYGAAEWGLGSGEVERGLAVDRQLRETRYGFGREARHRIVFCDAEAEPELARWAGRDALAHVVEGEALLGRDE